MLLAKQVPGDGLCKADEPRWGVYVFFTLSLVKRTFLGCWWLFYIFCSSRNLLEIMYPLKFNEDTPKIAMQLHFPPNKKMEWLPSSDHHEQRWTVHEFTLPATVLGEPNGITPRKTCEYRTKLGMTKVVLRGSWTRYPTRYHQEGLYKVPPLENR